MSISYEHKGVSFQAGCCLMPFSSRTGLTVNTSSKLFKNTDPQGKSSVIKSQQQIKERKEGIQAMKKSISTINLKRKYSDGYPTNQVSLNQSQFVFKPERRFITHSMDTQVLKNYIPHYQSTTNLSSGAVNDIHYERIRTQYFVNSPDTLESLAQKFKKSRDIKVQEFVQKTKKHKVEQNYVHNSFQTQTLQKTNARQFCQNPNQIQKNSLKYPNHFNKVGLDFIRSQREPNEIKNPEEQRNAKLVELGAYNQNQDKNSFLKLQMNQVDSMIIEINAPKSPSVLEKRAFMKKRPGYLGVNKQITESKLFGGSQITKTKKKSLAGQGQLANYETMTVNSDYEEDEREKIQKIEESAIMVNFFNPPSFIKEKLALSGTRHA